MNQTNNRMSFKSDKPNKNGNKLANTLMYSIAWGHEYFKGITIHDTE